MIVKDEAHVIERCLKSVKSLIDEVVIVDTGSTDNTIEIINNFLKNNDLPGKVIEDSWKGFAHGRTLALKESRKTNCDYSLMIDADEVLSFRKGFDIEEFKKSLHHDVYDIPTNMADTIYYRPTLTSNKKELRYVGVVHEFLDSKGGFSRGQVDHETQFFNNPIQDSARNKNPRKFQDDAALLEEAIANETEDFLKARYTFYAAQSYKDSTASIVEPEERMEFAQKAIDLYLKRIKMGHWKEECYQSCLKAGNLQEDLKYPEETIICTYLKGLEFNAERAEIYYYLTKYCRTHDRNHFAYTLSKGALNKTIKRSFLFTEKWIYDFGILDEFAISAYWSGHYKESYDACQKLIKNPLLPPIQHKRIQQNLNFAKDRL